MPYFGIDADGRSRVDGWKCPTCYNPETLNPLDDAALVDAADAWLREEQRRKQNDNRAKD